MKRWQQRLLLLAVMGLFVFLVVTQGTKETPYSRRINQLYIKPFVEATIYGVITEVRDKSFDLESVLYHRNAKEFVYRDLKTNGLNRFEVSRNEPVRVGDTIRKGKGQNWFLLFRVNGKVYQSYPIESM